MLYFEEEYKGFMVKLTRIASMIKKTVTPQTFIRSMGQQLILYASSIISVFSSLALRIATDVTLASSPTLIRRTPIVERP